MAEVHRTIADRGTATVEIRGSEFIGRAVAVETVPTAEEFVADVRAAHPDASHTVPAYRIRAGELVREYQHDDGEPTGSAGKPALNVLQRRDLVNVAVTITRYFGGTELGVGGLARAYARATNDAIDDAGVVERHPHERFEIRLDYDDSGTVRSILESAGVEFEAAYDERVSFDVRVPVTDAASLRDRIRSATSDRVAFEDRE